MYVKKIIKRWHCNVCVRLHVKCFWITGPDWNRGEEDGGVGIEGIVVRKLKNRFVMVSADLLLNLNFY